MSEKRRPRNGKPASTLTAKRSTKRVAHPDEPLKRLLKKVYDQYQKLDDRGENAKARELFAFHMADWADDLQRLAQVYRHPETADINTAGDAVFGFLVHAVHHLLAAARNLDVKAHDIFVEIDAQFPAKPH